MRCQKTGQEEEYQSDGSITLGGEDRGDGNNRSETINDRA